VDVGAVEVGLGVALAVGDADAFADVLAFGDADAVALGLASFADSAAVDALALPAAFAELLGVAEPEAVDEGSSLCRAPRAGSGGSSAWRCC